MIMKKENKVRRNSRKNEEGRKCRDKEENKRH